MNAATQRKGKRMELETINKLYLELSQITTATTAREILLQKQLAEAKKDSERLDWIEKRSYIGANAQGQQWYVGAQGGTVSGLDFRAAIDAAKGWSS